MNGWSATKLGGGGGWYGEKPHRGEPKVIAVASILSSLISIKDWCNIVERKTLSLSWESIIPVKSPTILKGKVNPIFCMFLEASNPYENLNFGIHILERFTSLTSKQSPNNSGVELKFWTRYCNPSFLLGRITYIENCLLSYHFRYRILRTLKFFKDP